MNSSPENEARGGAPGRPPGDSGGGAFLAAETPEEEGRGRRPASRPQRRLVPLVVGLLVIALVVGGVLLWLSYGDRAGGTSDFEESYESGPEPVVRLTNGPGRVRIEGVEGLESVEVSARRYARGFSPAAARENASGVPVDVSSEGSEMEISSDGGRGTGVDYDLRVPQGSIVEVEAEVGDVEVSGLDNNVTVSAENGDVTVEDVQGSISIQSPRGDVTVESVSTETGNAEIVVGTGDVEIEDLIVGLLEVQVEAGDVTLSGRVSGSGRIFVETGSINSNLPSEDARDLDLEARVGEVVREEQGSE